MWVTILVYGKGIAKQFNRLCGFAFENMTWFVSQVVSCARI